MATVRNLIVRISVTENTDRGIKRVTTSLRETNRELDNANKNSGRFNATLSRLGRGSVSGLVAGLKGLTKYTGVAAKGLLAVAAAASALNTVTQAGTALAPLAGGLLLIPAAALAAGAALGTLTLATNGMGDAFKQALAAKQDPKKFAAALHDLAPAARSVAVELHNLRPELLSIRNTAQQNLFKPLEGQLTALTKVLSGPLKQGVADVAIQFGLAGRQVAEFARQSGTVAVIQKAFAATAGSLGILRTALDPVLVGFRDLAQVGLSFLPGIASLAATIASRFGTWLQQLVASGRAADWISNALATLRQLGTVLGNVGGILKSVFSAASAAGSGFLGVIGQALASLNAFLKTAAGKSALQGIFQGLAAIGQSLSPVIAALVQGLGQLAGPIGLLAQLLGPILTEAITALAPALAALEPGLIALFQNLGSAVTFLAPALLPLAKAISSIGIAIAPILPVVGQLAALLAQQLAASITQVTSILGPVIAAFAVALAPVLPQIAYAFQQVATAMAPIATQFGQQLAQALAQALPPLLAIIPQLLNGLLPAFTQLVVQMTPLLPQLLQLGVILANNLAKNLPPLIPPLIQLVNLMVEWSTLMIPALGWILKISTALATNLNGGVTLAVQVVSWGLNLIFGWFQWLYDVLLGHSIIPDIVNGIINWFGSLPSRVASIFYGLAKGAIDQVSGLLRSLSKVPGWITSVFSGAGSWLVQTGKNIMIGLWNGIASLGNWIYNRMVALVRAVIPAPIRWALNINSPSKVTTELGKFVGLGLVAGMKNTVPTVRNAASSLASAAVPSLAQPAVLNPAAMNGVAPAGVSAAAAGGGLKAQITLDVTGGDSQLKTMVKKWVRVDGGGDVQIAFGRA